VTPAKAKATLGDVVGTLNSQDHLWRLALHGHDGSQSVAPLVSMLRLMWPNPDRHGGQGSRQPSLVEAQAVVHLAVTIVQWARSDVLSKRPCRFWRGDPTSGAWQQARPEFPVLVSRGVSDRCPPCGWPASRSAAGAIRVRVWRDGVPGGSRRRRRARPSTL